MNLIISGGGTGGHIFPALAIGKEAKKRFPAANVRFAGAVGGMEMDLVPKNGFEIDAIWISGIHRQLNLRNILRNLLFPLKFFVSLVQAYLLIRRHKPDVVVGVGGYASGPLCRVAGWLGIPYYICEQNAFPGLTNRWLAQKADKILLGNAAAAQYFEKDKCVVTGNPIREFQLTDSQSAKEKLGLDKNKPLILSLGGSLGARALNEAWLASLDTLIAADVQLVWQCGKFYHDAMKQQVSPHPNLKLMAFVEDMALAYSAADLIVSRAGASTISELEALEKVAILVPSPNVAEDHQTKNAMSLVEAEAALLVKDADAKQQLAQTAIALLSDASRLQAIKQKLAQIPKHDAAKEILEVILRNGSKESR